jgi:hypothetical protein
MATVYTGNGPYCYSNSLHMCLTQAGMAAVPPVSLLECMTGMPFGASFRALDPPLFFPSPGARTDPDRGLTRALDTIGWECALRRFEDAGAAEADLRAALAEGPVLLGPLDMGGLLYDPLHAHKRGGDHFVVALGREGDRVRLHDPQLYPFAVLPLPDLMQCWNAKGIAYASAAYTLRGGFRARRPVSEAEMLARTLATAREMAAGVPAGPVAYGGAPAFERAAELLRAGPPEAFTGMLMYFGLPLGARRCGDAAGFFERIDRIEAARRMVEKGEAYGEAQYHAVRGDWARTAEVFDRLARIESQFATALWP